MADILTDEERAVEVAAVRAGIEPTRRNGEKITAAYRALDRIAASDAANAKAIAELRAKYRQATDAEARKRRRAVLADLHRLATLEEK